ncbi:hypothetical protein [Paraburkholderia adhaesiva]|uniref:hypothetical protein n=1 Tax=Paraburkholderia adhaesiva TaxID=2883244 RepID=UPI001F29ACEE|nr:hypothetical protein [Paraburkholderia adhaesiva]
MNYHGTARTNYVSINDIDGLRAAIASFNLEVHEHPEFAGTYAFFVSNGLGWPDHHVDDKGNDIGLNVCKVIMPFVHDGEVLVLMDSGNQGHHYVCGRAEAWRRHADQTESVAICLHSIYAIAADRFAVPVGHISQALH